LHLSAFDPKRTFGWTTVQFSTWARPYQYDDSCARWCSITISDHFHFVAQHRPQLRREGVRFFKINF
jgi:hypothetical protein